MTHTTAIAKEAKHNPKKFWKFIKSKTTTKTGIEDLKIKDGTGQERNITEDQEKAEVLSKYFCSVFTQEPEENQRGAQSRECNIKMLNLEITEQDLAKKLEKLKIDKSPGPDQLYPRVLYEVRNVIAQPLRTLFIRSLYTGEIPDDWLKADIVALYKKGS